jgi:phage nucleotide-binding protein
MNFETIPQSINRGIAFLIYSDPGVGKTTLASTLPSKETLIVGCEAGLGPLLGTEHAYFNVLSAMANKPLEEVIDELYRFLRTQKHPFKYLVIDNVSELEQQLILYLTNKRKKETPEIREYGDSSFKMKEWVHQFRDLIYQGITVVFNAWEFPLEIKNHDGVILTKTFPLIGKKIAPQICGIVDVVGHLEVHEKSGKRWIRFGPSDQFITKCQFKGLENGEPADLPLLISKLLAYNYKEVNE